MKVSIIFHENRLEIFFKKGRISSSMITDVCVIWVGVGYDARRFQ